MQMPSAVKPLVPTTGEGFQHFFIHGSDGRIHAVFTGAVHSSGALIIRPEFSGPIYYSYTIRNPQNSIGNLFKAPIVVS